MTAQPFFFTWTAQKSARGQDVTGGHGARFTTADGAEWLDYASLSYQASLGHGHPRMVQAIVEQAQTLCLASPTAVYPKKREAAEMLLAMAPPGFSRVMFTLGGSEANENAMKIAKMFTGRHKFISRYRSYHGATMGALALTGDFRRPPVEPLVPSVIHVLDSAEHIEQVLELEGPGTVAAVFLEPVPGANGVYVPPPDFFPRVRAACDKHGTLLVADEVLTGFGRCGKGFALENFGVAPDIITCSKAITAGYAPLGAVLVKEEIARHFEDKVFWAGLTNYAYPLGCAAAVEAMRIYKEENLYARSEALGKALLSALQEVARKCPTALTAVRGGLGLLAAVDVKADADGWQRLTAELDRRRLFLHVSEKRGTIVFSPPLNISDADFAAGPALFAEAVAASLGGAT